MNALRSMRGGEVVARTYIQQAIEHARQFKKAALAAEMQRLLEDDADGSAPSKGGADSEELGERGGAIEQESS